MFLPVVERELRVAARRRATYRLRFYSILALMAVLCYNLIGTKFRGAASGPLGLELFLALTVAAFIFSALTGVIATSDCVSREKREGTLGLLFLTDLKGYDVIHGKLTASSIHAFYALIGILPVLGIPLLMGGVTLPQFLQVSLALVTTVVFSLSVGVFVSTHSRDERKATVFTFLILGLITVAPFILFITRMQAMGRLPSSDSWLLLCCSPGFAVFTAAVQPHFWPPFAYWLSLLWLWAMSACLLAWSSVRLPKMSGDAASPWFAALARGLQIRFRLASGVPRRWLGINPFLWLAMRGEASRWRVWLFVAAVLGIWIAFWKQLGMFMFDWGVVSMVIGVLHLTLKIWIAAEASRRFLEDRKDNTFELILSTPLSQGEIIRGQWLALWKQFGGPIVALLLLEMALIFRGSQYFRDQMQADRLPLYLADMFFLIADSFALAWAGMWFGLKSRNRIQAILSALVLVVVSRYLIVGVLMSLGASGLRWTDGITYYGMQALSLFCIGVSIDLPAIIFFRGAILRNFRLMATSQLSIRK